VDYELQGKSVIVTGGASHIGRAIVLALAAERASVAILDKDEAQAEQTAVQARELGAAQAVVVPADLLDPDQNTAAVENAVAALGGLDVLVNNVGGSIPDFFSRMSLEQWRRELDLNLLAPIVATRAALDVFVPQKRGAVVSISSDAAWGEPRTAVYGAAKAGVVALMRSLAKEHGRDGIRFNSVAPGAILPPEEGEHSVGGESVWAQPTQIWQNDEQLESVRRQIPLRRMASANDVAHSVLFLASDRTAHQLTGQVLSVSGGFHMTS
jgi:2-hydroxycyclohexanecarboxyl-CoA dehydrogenase